MNKENHFWSTSIIGLVLDFSIWVLPIPVIGKLNLPSRQKLGLVAVFGLGGLCVPPFPVIESYLLTSILASVS